eukprot:CAMPEP_0179460772 /NCGR_PEP_ID=MMETSP0799-20121207/43711_1 /TAXON_ID=46947 /ORGANISM="Geminigera cryophila, Strain CCMP2564" /LENGTH=489 /DNA_ID=CAMNT_0021263135 /DNA_START=116 /DNA_END=1585 /DNA_ORIENTATION=-
MSTIKHLRAISDEYKPGKELGKGTYGLVHICSRNISPETLNLVIKKIDLQKMKRKDIADLVKEAKLLQMFDHPNIVKLVDYFSTPDTLCIIQDYCNAHDMAWEVKQMKSSKTLFKEDVIWNWFLQLCCAVKHIHDRKILHRDIKTANIFLHTPDPNSWPVVKLGDFGISKALDTTSALAKSTVGTPYYMSPELCDNKPYSYKSDVWAVGIVLYELATLRQPFDSHNFNGLVLKILKGKYEKPSKDYSSEMHRMIKTLLVGEQDKRPDVTEVLNMEICKAKIFKSGIAVDVLQREFSHTALHGFKPLDILNSAGEIKAVHSAVDNNNNKAPAPDGSVYGVFGGLLTGLVGAVGDNMSKLYGAFDDLALDPELQNHESWERDAQNIADLRNGGDKFLLDGKTLELPGVTPSDTTMARIEALRIFLEKQLGAGTFMTVYTIMNAVSEGDDEIVLENQLRAHVGERNMHYLCLVAQLIFCEEKANEQQNASTG